MYSFINATLTKGCICWILFELSYFHQKNCVQWTPCTRNASFPTSHVLQNKHPARGWSSLPTGLRSGPVLPRSLFHRPTEYARQVSSTSAQRSRSLKFWRCWNRTDAWTDMGGHAVKSWSVLQVTSGETTNKLLMTSDDVGNDVFVAEGLSVLCGPLCCLVTRSSAIAERPLDASYHWIFC